MEGLNASPEKRTRGSSESKEDQAIQLVLIVDAVQHAMGVDRWI